MMTRALVSLSRTTAARTCSPTGTKLLMAKASLKEMPFATTSAGTTARGRAMRIISPGAPAARAAKVASAAKEASAVTKVASGGFDSGKGYKGGSGGGFGGGGA